jgi:hypothetical protein
MRRRLTEIAGLLLCVDHVLWECNRPAAGTTKVIHNITNSHMVQCPAAMTELMKLIIT